MVWAGTNRGDGDGCPRERRGLGWVYTRQPNNRGSKCTMEKGIGSEGDGRGMDGRAEGRRDGRTGTDPGVRWSEIDDEIAGLERAEKKCLRPRASGCPADGGGSCRCAVGESPREDELRKDDRPRRESWSKS